MKKLITLVMATLLTAVTGLVHSQSIMEQPATDGTWEVPLQANVERIHFMSETPKDRFSFARRSYKAPAVKVYGDLIMPPNVTGPVPVIVLAHSSAGVESPQYDLWAKNFAQWGYATFIVDSFGPRGLKFGTASQQEQVSQMANVADALHALIILAADKRFDPRKIVIMGYSRGGEVALQTYLDIYRHGVIKGNLRFAAHLPFYPGGCDLKFRDDNNKNLAPMRFELGGADNGTPAAACVMYADQLMKEDPARDITYRVYKGAYHGFDTNQELMHLSSLQNAKNCDIDIHMDMTRGTINAFDHKENVAITNFEQFKIQHEKCLGRGYTFGKDRDAQIAVVPDVRDFLSRVFLAVDAKRAAEKATKTTETTEANQE